MLGVAGSLHCAGMCGPLALALPVTGNRVSGFVLGRIAYNLGRVITYAALGIIFGLAGRTLLMAGIQRWVSIALGLLLLIGFFGSRRLTAVIPINRMVERLKFRMASLLRRRSLVSFIVLGLLNGLLPCGT